MALKKRHKVEAAFSMSSMTDIIFLLLLFFMIASTMSAPNDMRVRLPQSRNKTATKAHMVKVGITPDAQYKVALGGAAPQNIEFDELEPYLQAAAAQDSTIYIALHADERTPFAEVVKVLDIANTNNMKIVVATKVKN